MKKHDLGAHNLQLLGWKMCGCLSGQITKSEEQILPLC